MPEHHTLPDGISEHPAEWHWEKFVDFTRKKLQVSEPSPHLQMVGHVAKSDNCSELETVWRIGCYAIPYAFAVGAACWSKFSAEAVLQDFAPMEAWVRKNWPGILAGTRRERRCVRSVENYVTCLRSYVDFLRNGYQRIRELPRDKSRTAYYDAVWEEVTAVQFFGRYISIRVVEGLRRFVGIPAELYDIRAMGAWSPRKCLVYLDPANADTYLTDTRDASERTNELASEMARRIAAEVPGCTFYIFAAMLCEYRDAFEDRRQYVGWTIDQEPLLLKKTAPLLANSDFSEADFWKARASLFPAPVLGEHQDRWCGTRWDLTPLLRDHGYVWSDLLYDYNMTLSQNCWANPVPRNDASGNPAEVNSSPGSQKPSSGPLEDGKPARRGGVNVITPTILQRGQILSWSLEDKREFFQRHGITMVVNFWSKLDHDFSECWGVTYHYIPRPDSRGMLEPDIQQLAHFVVNHLATIPGSRVLVLCEAGRTRSVYFCVLLYALQNKVSLREAYRAVDAVLQGRHSLKSFMMEVINRG